MPSDLRSRLVVVSIVCLASLYFLLGTFKFLIFSSTTSVPAPDETEKMEVYKVERNEALKGSIRFGLDLMGGVDVLLSINEDKIARDQLDDLRKAIRRELQQVPIPATLRAKPDAMAIDVTVEDKSLTKEALTILTSAGLKEAFQPFDEAEFQRSGTATLAMRTDHIHRQATDAISRTRDLLNERVDELGLVQPSVVIQGTKNIRIQLPGETDPQGTVRDVVQPAYLTFRLVHPQNMSMVINGKVTDQARQQLANDPAWVIKQGKLTREDANGQLVSTETEVIVESEPQIKGEDIANAFPRFIPPGKWEISLEFNKSGIGKMARLTKENTGRYMAILLDDVVRSYPSINEPILDGRCSISGGFTMNEAYQLAKVISTGALPVELRTESSQVIEARLGADSIRDSMVALAVGSVLVAFFMIYYYAGAGMLAIVATVVNVLVLMGLLAAWGATLTLSGVGGILLTIGMAVDANVLIYERIREELRAGKKALEAIESGFENSFSTIVDANMTTLIAVLILLQFGSGAVQGFALTMTFGIIGTLFAGIYVTRLLVDMTFGRDKKVSVGNARMIGETRLDFMSLRRYTYTASLCLLGLGVLSVLGHGGFKMGVDFAGGVIAQVELTDAKNMQPTDVRNALRAAEPSLSSVDVVKVVNSDNFMVKSRLLNETPTAADDTMSAITNGLNKAFPNAHRIASHDQIGREVSGNFASTAILALVLGCLGILAYVAVRFEFWFGVAAVMALVHDVSVALAFVSFLNIEITLDIIAALLVILGYSINDTIVIFDRVREMLGIHVKDSIEDISNAANNQCLNRTVVTSMTAILCVLAMLFFGGQGLHDFSTVLLVGMVSGIYSTIFIASPLLVTLTQRAARKQAEAEAAAKGGRQTKGRRAAAHA